MIPIQFILAGPLFNVIGGGSTVLVASLYSMVSDVVEGKDRYVLCRGQASLHSKHTAPVKPFFDSYVSYTSATRASVFFFMAFASLLGAAVSPALSSRFMEAFSPWAAVLLGFFAVPVGVSVLAFIPETFPQSKRESFPKDDPAGPERPRRNTFLSHLSHSILLLEASIAMLRSPSIVLILATFLTQTPEVIATSQSFVQYVSKRFDWPLATAGYLLTIKGIMNMIVLLLMLPLLSKLLIHGRHPGAKDLVLARFSAAFAAAGALLMAASQMGVVVSGLALHSLGAGLAPLCRSLATSYLAPQDTSKINTLIGIVGTVGTLFATPALAWLFETGMKLKGAWLGLPYFGLAALFALCLLGLFFVSALRREDAEDGYDETGEVPRGDPLSTRGDLDQNA
ncbi:major facilitator superfamily domain-containing protein [Aspergillus coremiiformis]|uniref:Major facilitator superfamily domain-containing protein n=1 Tax=Aspergillus coremiiformis TaxID=138285 RepID=A0A5N6Z2H3_9EURO|nr:major facilitator superfamily domain-containing protein [Aspergillus coremiiformis]